MIDVLIRGGKVIDGTGAPWFRADVAIQDGKIAAVERQPMTEQVDGELEGAAAATVLDATAASSPRASLIRTPTPTCRSWSTHRRRVRYGRV